MYDYFTEYLVKRRKNIVDFLIMFLAAFAGVFITLFLFLSGLLFVQLIGQVLTIGVVALWWGVYFLITSRSLEFEYIVTNGELDVDKVIGKRKRKRLISVKAKEIELITAEENYRGNADVVIDASSRNGVSKNFVLITAKDGKRTKIIFNPSEKMLKIFKVFCQRKVEWSEDE